MDNHEGTWVDAGASDAIGREDVMRFDHDGRTFAIYRTAQGTLHSTDGLCTHGKVHLADGYVMGHLIECPKHNGRFDYTTGQAKRAPACADLKTHAVREEGGRVWLRLE